MFSVVVVYGVKVEGEYGIERVSWVNRGGLHGEVWAK